MQPSEMSGYMENFVTKYESDRGRAEIQHDATVIAIGADEYKVTECLYGQDELVMTQFDLEDKISIGDEKIVNARSLVMIQCVACRNADRDYYTRICCRNAISNALNLKEINPQMDIYILFRNKRAFGFGKNYFRKLADKNIRFIRYKLNNIPKVEPVEEGGPSGLKITLPDYISGYRLVINADAIALVAPVISSSGA